MLYLVSGQLSTWYWSADTYLTAVNNNHNVDIQYQTCTYGNGATLLFFKVLGLDGINIQTVML